MKDRYEPQERARLGIGASLLELQHLTHRACDVLARLNRYYLDLAEASADPERFDGVDDAA